jgi:hypothetical protein
MLGVWGEKRAVDVAYAGYYGAHGDGCAGCGGGVVFVLRMVSRQPCCEPQADIRYWVGGAGGVGVCVRVCACVCVCWCL